MEAALPHTSFAIPGAVGGSVEIKPRLISHVPIKKVVRHNRRSDDVCDAGLCAVCGATGTSIVQLPFPGRVSLAWCKRSTEPHRRRPPPFVLSCPAPKLGDHR